MAWVSIYFSIFANTFCPNLYFDHINSCMQFTVMMHVYVFTFVFPWTVAYTGSVYTYWEFCGDVLVGGCCMLNECVECVWNCVCYMLPTKRGDLSVRGWLKVWSVWHCVCEGCVDQHCRIELSALSNRVAVDSSTCYWQLEVWLVTLRNWSSQLDLILINLNVNSHR